MTEKSGEIPTLFIFGPSKSGKDTFAKGIAEHIPGLVIPSTSALLTRLKKDADQLNGVEKIPDVYPRNVLYDFGVDLQNKEPAVLARLIAEENYQRYKAGEISGLLYVGSRRFAEAEYVRECLGGKLVALTAPFDVRLSREFDDLFAKHKYPSIHRLRKNFLEQDMRELPELDQMLNLADIVIDGTEDPAVMIAKGLRFAREKKVF